MLKMYFNGVNYCHGGRGIYNDEQNIMPEKNMTYLM